MEKTSRGQKKQVGGKRSLAPDFLLLCETSSSVAGKSYLLVLNSQVVADKVSLAPCVSGQEAKEQVGGDVHHVSGHCVVHTSQAHVVLVPQAIAQLSAVVDDFQKVRFLKHSPKTSIPSLYSQFLNIEHEHVLLGGKQQESKRTCSAKKSTFA